MYCKHCGKLIDGDSKFCSWCGEAVADESHNRIHDGHNIHGERPDQKGTAGHYVLEAISKRSRRRRSAGLLLAISAFIALASGIVWLALILGAIGGYLIYKTRDPEDPYHHLYKCLGGTGYTGIRDLSRHFEELKNKTITSLGKYRLNTEFLWREKYFSIEIYPLSQMYWAYRKVVQHSINFIPTHKTYEIVMHFRPNKTLSIQEHDEDVTNDLLLLTRLCPNAHFGYTKPEDVIKL